MSLEFFQKSVWGNYFCDTQVEVPRPHLPMFARYIVKEWNHDQFKLAKLGFSADTDVIEMVPRLCDVQR